MLNRCKIPEFENDTYEIIDESHNSLINQYIQKLNKTAQPYDKCSINIVNETLKNQYSMNNNETSYKCEKWVYSKKYYTKTITTDVRICK